MDDLGARLKQLRIMMKEKLLDGLIVKGTDRFLNEYVPTEESTRVWISGFTGSTGDVLIGMDDAYLFVDGRYYLQADQESDPSFWTVNKVPMGVSLQGAMASLLLEKFNILGRRIGIESDRYSVRGFQDLNKRTQNIKLELVSIVPSLVEILRGELPKSGGTIVSVGDELTGRSVEDKLKCIRKQMAHERLDAFVIQKLDEIAYLTNLRGDEIPFQSTFKSIVVVYPEQCVVAISGGMERGEGNISPSLTLMGEEDWLELLRGKEHSFRVGYDPSSTTEWVRKTVEGCGSTLVPTDSPLAPMKAMKTPQELRHMIHSFHRADLVVQRGTSWLCDQLDRGDSVSEADFAEKVVQCFKSSGARGLSFNVISAAGKNGAVIHYSHPDPDRSIKVGELMLLDTGAYYEGGYATDLTRTFLVGGKGVQANDQQRRIFTLVLKGAIAGMKARFPEGTSGISIDALVRSPIWEAGFTYNHGTGHGVGINVHESPPSISLHGNFVLEKGHIFSIEPGIYIEGFGGVRIENLCTVVDDPENPGFLAIVPLTFSPLDERLIETKMLSKEEESWLIWYKKESEIEHTVPPTPPILSAID